MGDLFVKRCCEWTIINSFPGKVSITSAANSTPTVPPLITNTFCWIKIGKYKEDDKETIDRPIYESDSY